MATVKLHHVPGRHPAFVVRGNLAPEVLREIAERELASLEAPVSLPARPSDKPVDVEDARLDIVMQNEKSTQRSIVMRKLFRMPEREELAELASVSVLNHLLRSRLTGSFYDFIIEQRKIPNEQLSASLGRIRPGLFLLDIRADVAEGVDGPTLAGAMADFLLSEARSITPSARNIERMRKRAIDAANQGSQAPAQVFPQLVQWLAAGRPFSEFGRMPHYLERVTEAEITAAYTAFTGPGRLVSGVLLPNEEARP